MALVVPASPHDLAAIRAQPTNQALPNEPPRSDGPNPPSRVSSLALAKPPARSPAGASAALVRKKPDCSQTYDLDDQGRKHFKAECMKAPPTSMSNVVEKPSGCDPNFDLDDQGRKHFKPECFLGSGN
jgi:hypothetical protein